MNKFIISNMKNTIFILCCLFCAALCQRVGAQSTETLIPRRLREVNFSGSGYKLGLQHGQQLKKEIGEIVVKWKKSVETQLNTPADQVVKAFFEYARFDKAIKMWTPDLYEEVRGIAEGSGQAFNDIMVHNLLDEFWVWQDAHDKHHCSGIGVPSRDGAPGYIAQNMDLEGYTDGYQVLMRLARTSQSPEQLILTYPGCIALNGLNEAGIGACMNTLMQLKGNATGLPVAFIVRGILGFVRKDNVLRFIEKVPHASGQNYIIGIRGEVYDFEASANKVVRFDPQNANGTVYHTNHPIVNDDLKDWYKNPKSDNSTTRLASVQSRIAHLAGIKDDDIKSALRAKDDPKHPVCRTYNQWGGSFGSVIMTLTGAPKLQITAGPPDESEYKNLYFNKLQGKGGWRNISGYLMDENNEAIVGGEMYELGDFHLRAVSGISGEFNLMVPPDSKELTCFYDGGTFDQKTVPFTNSDTLNVVLLKYGGNGITSNIPNLSHRVKRSQPTLVAGKINSGEGKMVVRPCVRIEGTTTVVYAENDGNYTLTVPPQYDILSFESDNYPARKVLLGDFKMMHVSVTLWPTPQKEQPKRQRKKKAGR
jgi:isopenicillin-N N-acyltransferase like protein